MKLSLNCKALKYLNMKNMKTILFTAFIMLTFQVTNAQELTPPSKTKLTDKELGLQYLKKVKPSKLQDGHC